MSTNESNAISAESFIEKLWKEYLSQRVDCQMNFHEFINSGILKGWIPDGFLSQSSPDRKNIAWVIHEFLKKECDETDEEDISTASKLQDIYDCHSCVNHIAQVYEKGIMEEVNSNPLVFGASSSLQESEADLIAKRIFYKRLRKLPKREASAKKALKLSYKDAMELLQNNEVKLIDVRSKQKYEDNHLQGAYHILLSEILTNPYQVAEKEDTQLLFYCEQAYQSQIAANCVADAGFTQVCYFGIEDACNTNTSLL